MADNTPTAFDEPTARRVLDATLAFERGVRPMSKHRHRLPQGGGDESAVYGQVIDDWTDADDLGNILFLYPCDSEGENVDGETVVCGYIHSPRKDPHEAVPEAVPILEGDIVAYLPIDVDDGVLRGSTAVDEYGLLIDTETMRGTYDSPDAIDPSTITGSNTTAQSDTWDRTNQGAFDGVAIKKHVRTAYDDGAGTPILYGFWRLFTYDSTGRLVTISAETRYIIDSPEDCP